MNKVDKITMEYMSNKNYIEHVDENKEKTRLQNNKEERFYRKRLILLYKELFKNKKEADKNVLYAFEKFNNIGIEYLKQKDTCEIVQNELGNKSNQKEVQFSQDIPLENIDNDEELNIKRDKECFQNTNTIKKCTLDDYIIKKPIKKKQVVSPPQKIEIKLKTKELKNKDINKKNINKKYDNEQKKNEEQTT